MLMKKYSIIFVVLTMLALSGCQLNPFKDVSWNVDLEAPIAFTEVGIWDLITDTTSFDNGSDNKLALIYRDTVVSLQIRDMVEIPDTTSTYVVTLDTLSLDSDTIAQQITMADFARQLLASNDPTSQQAGALILANHGNTLPFIPAFTGQSSPPVGIDASQFFESALLESGELALIIENQFPISLRNVIFSISNANLGTDIIRDTFPSIPSKTDISRSYDIAGVQLESSLEGQLENLDVDAALFVPIDTNDYIAIKLVAQNLKPIEATAVFPSQTIVDTLTERTYEFPGDLAGMSLTKLVVRAGQIRADATSTVEDTIGFLYELPKALDKDGNIPSVYVKVPPAPPGGSSSQTETFQLEGFTLDLTGEGETFNTLVERIAVSLIYSGNLVTLNKNDSVNVDFTLESLEPVYLEGYIGQARFAFEGKEVIDVFDELDVSRIKFSEAEASINFINSIGLPSQIVVEEFKAQNSSTGKSVRLANSEMVAGPLRIGSPQLPDTNGVVSTVLNLTPTNSNINPFISSLADEVSYNLTLETNPEAAFRLDNFITENSAMDVVLDFKLPLVGVVDRLLISDTTDFMSEGIDLEDIASGGLNLVIENGFPLELSVSAVVYDENWAEIDRLTDNTSIAPAAVSANGRAESPGISTINYEFTPSELNEVLEEGRKIIFNFVLNTKPEEKPVEIYSDYRVKAKLVGDFEYKLSN